MSQVSKQVEWCLNKAKKEIEECKKLIDERQELIDKLCMEITEVEEGRIKI